jgi:hypothetical protein
LQKHCSGGNSAQKSIHRLALHKLPSKLPISLFPFHFGVICGFIFPLSLPFSLIGPKERGMQPIERFSQFGHWFNCKATTAARPPACRIKPNRLKKQLFFPTPTDTHTIVVVG